MAAIVMLFLLFFPPNVPKHSWFCRCSFQMFVNMRPTLYFCALQVSDNVKLMQKCITYVAGCNLSVHTVQQKTCITGLFHCFYFDFFSCISSTSCSKLNTSSLGRHEEVLMIFLSMVWIYIFNGRILKYIMRDNWFEHARAKAALTQTAILLWQQHYTRKIPLESISK